MKFFLLTIFSFVFAGIALRKWSSWNRSLVLMGLTLAVCFGYFFLNQI